MVKKLSATCDSLFEKTEQLADTLKNVPGITEDALQYYANNVVPQMELIRKDADLLESVTAKSYWPYPTYSDMLYY